MTAPIVDTWPKGSSEEGIMKSAIAFFFGARRCISGWSCGAGDAQEFTYDHDTGQREVGTRTAIHAARITGRYHVRRPIQEGTLYHPRQNAGRLYDLTALAQHDRKRHGAFRHV